MLIRLILFFSYANVWTFDRTAEGHNRPFYRHGSHSSLISIVSNSYYGMPRGQIHINVAPEHPIMSFETIEIKMVAVSVKRSILVECFWSRSINSQVVFFGPKKLLLLLFDYVSVTYDIKQKIPFSVWVFWNKITINPLWINRYILMKQEPHASVHPLDAISLNVYGYQAHKDTMQFHFP